MGKFGGHTPARLVAAAAWAGAALALSSCAALSSAMGGESKDTAEIVADAPEASPAPLDLGLDPADVIQEGEGDSSTLNTRGWPGTTVPPGDYVVHLQCRGAESLSFNFGTASGSERMSSFGCGGPTWFSVSAPGEGYGFSLNTNPADADGIEYIFAVTKPDVVSS